MDAAAGQNREIEHLKTLLFEPETARLQALETDVSSLQQYVGSADRLQAATADVLVSALERAEVDRPRELASAIAPSVISAIRKEIHNSRDMMVDALYPITGRLVSAAVANAFRELVARLERRINVLTSTELWTGRVKSLVTGRPLAEFVLADSNPPRVNRLLIIERGNGRLIADWKRDETHDERADLLSAMVAAILEFSVQALGGGGTLQKLDFGGREIVLRASPRFILAAECLGSLRPADDARINALFFDAIESMDRGSSPDSAMLDVLAGSIEVEPASRAKTSRRGKFVLFGLLALAFAALLWLGGIWATRSMLEHRTNVALRQLVSTQPLLASFPLHLDFDHGERRLAVSGIEPSQVKTAPIIEALAAAAAPYRIVDRIGIVPGLEQSAELRAGIAAMQQSLARIQTGIDETRSAIAAESKSRNEQYAGLRAQAGKLDEQYARLGEQLARLGEQYAGMQSIVDGPAARLNRFAASTAVFFGNGDEFLDGEQAERQLRELAALLTGNDLRIRIVGHADESGSETGNKLLGRKRAEQVQRRLISLGIDQSRLFLVSRSASMPITDKVGAGTGGNRRATFEDVFPAEAQP